MSMVTKKTANKTARKQVKAPKRKASTPIEENACAPSGSPQPPNEQGCTSIDTSINQYKAGYDRAIEEMKQAIGDLPLLKATSRIKETQEIISSLSKSIASLEARLPELKAEKTLYERKLDTLTLELNQAIEQATKPKN